MAGFALLLAALAMSAPQFSFEDIKYMAIHGDGRVDRENLWAAASIDLWINPDGKVADCTVALAVGDEETARSFCSRLIGHAMGEPRGPDGSPAFASISAVVSEFSDLQIPNQRKLMRPIDDQLHSAQPEGQLEVPSSLFTQTGESGLHAYIQTDGSSAACEGVGAVSPELAKEACRRVASRNFRIRTNQGKPVPYVKYVELLPGG